MRLSFRCRLRILSVLPANFPSFDPCGCPVEWIRAVSIPSHGRDHLFWLLSPCNHEMSLHLQAVSCRWHFLKFIPTGLSCLLYCFYPSLPPTESQSNPSGTPYMYFGIQIIFVSKYCGHHSLCCLFFSFCFCMISRGKGLKWGEVYLFLWLYSDQKSCF